MEGEMSGSLLEQGGKKGERKRGEGTYLSPTK